MSMPSFDAKAFVLSEKESTRVFEQAIIPAEFSGFFKNGAAEPSPLPSPPPSCGWRRYPPVAVLIVGQTGAGKTHAAPAIKEVFESIVRSKSGQSHGQREGTDGISSSRGEEEGSRGEQEGPMIAHFVADTYKTYHPAYTALSAGDANGQTGRASAATGPDARRWLAMAVRHAVALRLDVLLESACRHSEDFVKLAQTFHEGGYRVEVVLMAVPAGLSRLGILTRFYRQRTPEEDEPTPPSLRRGSLSLMGRLTPKKVHDDSYEGLLHAAEFIDESDAVDQVVLVRRDNLVVYADERLEDGVWKQRDLGSGGRAGGAAEALRRERRRPLIEGERAAAMEYLSELRKIERGPRSGLLIQLADVEALLQPLLTETMVGNDESFPVASPLALPGKTGLLSGQNDDHVDLRLGT